MIDGPANRSHAGLISIAASRVPIRILPAQEDLQIARHVRSLLASRSGWPQKG
jgi:acetate kinase